MNRLLALCLVAALLAPGVAVPAPAKPQVTGSITGVARDDHQHPVAHHLVRLRDLATNQVVGTTRTNAEGAYLFTGVRPGTYVVELVDSNKKVVAAIWPLSVTPGSVVSAGVLVVAGAATSASAGFFATTAGIILLAAAGAGVGVGVYEAVRSKDK